MVKPQPQQVELYDWFDVDDYLQDKYRDLLDRNILADMEAGNDSCIRLWPVSQKNAGPCDNPRTRWFQYFCEEYNITEDKPVYFWVSW